jgi:predicted ABC-type transport system involved in lysophospholipase L1 biosynthesis ATPase subunit
VDGADTAGFTIRTLPLPAAVPGRAAMLRASLDRYEGTLLLVTHDRALAANLEVTRRLVVSAGQVSEQ